MGSYKIIHFLQLLTDFVEEKINKKQVGILTKQKINSIILMYSNLLEAPNLYDKERLK